MTELSLVRQLLEAGVHFGHQTKRWNPKMKPYIFGRRAGIYIIDLEKTERQLLRACDFVEDLAAKGELVLCVGTKKQAKGVIEEQALRCGMPYVITRWLGGTLTNFVTIKRSIDRLITLRKQRQEGYFERLTKKDARGLEQDLEKLQKHLSGLVGLDRLPACLYVVDPKREGNAIHEAQCLRIPVVAICDTNADPDLIAMPIPGNDDAMRSIRFITSRLVDHILAGRTRAGLPIPLASSQENGAVAQQHPTESPAASVPEPETPAGESPPGTTSQSGEVREPA